MPTYKVASLNLPGVNVVIFPVSHSFTLRTPAEQDSMIKLFQTKVTAAGLKGNVVVVWDGEGGKINFKAPLNQHEFFNQITSAFIEAHLNKSITW